MNTSAEPEVGREITPPPTRSGRSLLVRTPRTLPGGLRSAMELAGITAHDLAAKAGLHPNTVGHYLQPLGSTNGRTPRADDLRHLTRVLAGLLGVTVEALWWEFGRLLDADPKAGPIAG